MSAFLNLPEATPLRPALLSAACRYDTLYQQPYARLTPEDHRVWSMLLSRQLPILASYADRTSYSALIALQLSPTAIPQFSELSRIVSNNGFHVAGTRGLMSDLAFDSAVSNGIFPASLWIRKAEEADYVVAPDLFHDIVGHCPMLTIPQFVRYLRAITRLKLKTLDAEWRALRGLSENCVEFVRRAYWFSIEYGLSHDGRLMGAGLLSSPGEAVYAATSTIPNRLEFKWLDVFSMSYKIDKFQLNYFILPKSIEILAEDLEDERENSQLVKILRNADKLALR